MKPKDEYDIIYDILGLVSGFLLLIYSFVDEYAFAIGMCGAILIGFCAKGIFKRFK